MSVVRKNMNVQKAEKIEITPEEKKMALAKFMATPVVSMDDLITQYTSSLNEYCDRFKAKNYDELMTRADELEFDAYICNDILDKYSFIQRNKIQ